MSFGKFIVFFFLLSAFSGLAQQVSPFNNLPVKTDSSGNYQFIISGHFYGDGTNRSGYPANTLLANLDWINESDACMLICLGDMFMDITNDLPKYKTSLFDKLKIPLFNAVGNHDLTGTVYEDNFGETFFMFRLGNDIHVVLDTELNNGDIEGDQLKMLSEVSEQCKREKINNVFVYAHRTIWKDSYMETEDLFGDNTQSTLGTNYTDEVLPIAKEIAMHSNLFWFAGSLGDAPASFFYFKDEASGIVYIATAIRALLRDAVLIADVRGPQVSFTTKSLTNQQLNNLEAYDTAFWKETSPEEPMSFKLRLYYVWQTFTHPFFWYGIAFATAFFGLIWYIRNRRKRVA